MVKLKFIIRDGALVLRISEGKERFYKSVRHLLVGTPNIDRHWNNDKERFTNYAVSYAENNKVLEDFKAIYNKISFEHPELSAKQVSTFYSHAKKVVAPTIIISTAPIDISVYSNSVEKYLEVVVQREKAKLGCNFENYYKLLKKCRKILPGFSSLSFQSLGYDSCVRIANIMAQHNGYKGTSKSFRNLLGKASRDKDVNFQITQIGDFKFNDYSPNRYEAEIKKPDVLDNNQLKSFLNVDMDQLTPSYKDRDTVKLYYDFCIFMFHSFFSPCDVIKLKYKDMTRKNTLMIRRKKTHQPVEVPISPAMEEIILRYRGATKDGYVFPIMDDEKERSYSTKDYLFKKFRERVNVWLKVVGKELGLSYDLYAYVFRHTAITVALDSGLPVSYVAMAAGTSIEMIQEHYYNGDSQQNQQKLQMAFMKAAQ